MAIMPNQQPLTDRLLYPVSLFGQPLVALMLLAPRARFTRRVVGSNLPFLLYGGLYTLLVMRGALKDPEVFRRIMRLDLDAITQFMGDRDSGVITAWTHMTTSDLFIARWIFLDSLARGKPARLPIVLQFFGGPVGVFVYLLSRRNTDNA